MTDPKTIADRYLAVWNEADDVRRVAMLAKDWAANARYVDPMMHGKGRNSIDAMIQGVRAQLPGHGFTLRGIPDGHGDYVRFSWDLAPEGAPAFARGTDVVRLDRDGCIVDVVGFLDAGLG